MKYFLFIILTCILASARAQIITTFAGGGTGGNGSLAVDASIGYCGYGSFDSIGNYYFVQSFSIQQVNIFGIIETVAGNGAMGYSGDGGPAISASFREAISEADAAGNIYIADYGNYRLRKIDAATGIIHTICGNGIPGHTGDGGLAINATIRPAEVCIDKHNNVYVCDSVWLRKIDGTTGIITTIAGDGNSGFSGDGGPALNADLFLGSAGICLDSLGNVYMPCNAGLRIRKLDVATGIITTVAGTGSGIYNGDNIPATTANFKAHDIAISPLDHNLYIADEFNSRIRMVDANGIIHTVVGTGVGSYSGDGGMADTAGINQPYGVSFDMCGNLYIADEANRRIRKITYNPTCIPIDTTHHNEAITNVAATDFSIYPNPANTEITVNAGNGFINTIIISNTLGQQVYTTQYTHTTKTTIDISHLPPGVYLIKLNNTHIQKIIKQ